MREETVKLFKIGELSDEAKEHAYEEWLGHGDTYFWASENEATLKAFCERWPVNVAGWSYGGQGDSVVWAFAEPYDWPNADEGLQDMRGIRLYKYIVNNYWYDLFERKTIWSKGGISINSKSRKSRCQWQDFLPTGYCMDYDITDPIRKFLKNPDKHTTFYSLMEDCLNSWLSSCTKDYEHSLSLEYFIEHAEANDYEYTEEGDMW
jgi:hypothetical protein